MSRDPVGVVGLGVMGSAMSGHLLSAGFPVLGFDVDPHRRADHESRGGTVCLDPAEVARGADIVVTSLPSAAALAAVVDGKGGLSEGARRDLVVIETSTLGPDTERDGHDRALLRRRPARLPDERYRSAGQGRRPGRLPQR
jgi:putative dehydrogenase